MIDSEKGVLVEEYRTTSLFAGYHTFASAGYIERYMEGAVFRFHETKKDDPIMALQIYLERLSIYIYLKVQMEEFVA